MADEDRTKEELVTELMELRQRIRLLEGRSVAEAPSVPVSPAENPLQAPALNAMLPSETEETAIAPAGTIDPFVDTIDLSRLVNQDASQSGTFVMAGKMRRTALGKIMQALPVPAFLVDESHRILEPNGACRKISPDYTALERTSFPDLFHSASVKTRARSLLEIIFSDRRPRSWEASFHQGTHEKIWARFSFRPVRIANLRFLLVIMEDLTQEKIQLHVNTVLTNQLEDTVAHRTAELAKINQHLTNQILKREEVEAALKKSEERFRDLAELLPEHVFEVDRRGFFTFSNRAGIESLGYTQEE